MTYAHPETGEEISTREEFQAALAEVEERMAPLYRVRRALRDAAVETWGQAELPSRTRRTDKQALVARCPRCGGRIDDEG